MNKIETLVIQDVAEINEEDIKEIRSGKFGNYGNITLIVQIISIVIQVMPVLIEWWKSRSMIVKPFSKYFIKRRLNKFINENGYKDIPVDKLSESFYTRLSENA